MRSFISVDFVKIIVERLFLQMLEGMNKTGYPDHAVLYTHAEKIIKNQTFIWTFVFKVRHTEIVESMVRH